MLIKIGSREISVEIIETKSISCNGSDNNECSLTYIRVKINDIQEQAEKIMVQILNNSWLSKFENEIDKASFIARAKPTIEILVNILSQVGNKIGAEFGEFLISSVAQTTLETNHNHKRFPLAEIWKEKAKGNPGFDFHTMDLNNILFYGEAKFNSDKNAYSKAISQICKFISKKKDIMELTDLQKLSSDITSDHLQLNTKGYVAAFSLHNNFDNIFTTIQNNKNLKQSLLKYPELFFIGIEV